MPKITFIQSGKTYEAAGGENILDVALRNEEKLPHACGGFGACTTCQVAVRSGGENLSPPEELEEDRLERATPPATLASRLGCQAKIRSGEVAVEIAGDGALCH